MRSDQIKNKGTGPLSDQLKIQMDLYKWIQADHLRPPLLSPRGNVKYFHTWGSRTANILIERSPSGSTCAMVSFRCPWVTFKRCGKFRRLLQTKLTFLCRLCSITVLQTSDPSFVYLEQNSTLHILARALCPLRCLCFSAPCFFLFFFPFSPCTAKHHDVLLLLFFALWILYTALVQVNSHIYRTDATDASWSAPQHNDTVFKMTGKQL